MTDKDASDMIARCIEEINGLRNAVAALRPKADAYALISKIIGLLPDPQQGCGDDIVWRLENHLAEIKKKAAVPPV